MLAIFWYGIIFLSAKGIGVVGGLFPANIEYPIRVYELKLLSKVRYQGPGGFDDAVQETVMSNRNIYTQPVLKLLASSQPGSSDEELALSFIEEVRSSPEVEAVLKQLAEQHPNPETRKLAQAILRS